MHRRTFVATAGLGALASALRPSIGHSAEEALPQLDLAQLRSEGDLTFPEEVRRLVGRRVAVSGYLIPHSRAGAAFRILAAEPLPICPHCFPDQPLPPESIFAYLREDAALPTRALLTVSGILDLGAKIDSWSAMTSMSPLLDRALYLS